MKKSKKNQFIQKDNLSNQQKKKLYLLLALSLSVIILFIVIIFKRKKEINDLLVSGNAKETLSRVVGRSSSKVNGDVFEYNVDGKIYRHHNRNSLTRSLGEVYKIKYSPSNPKIRKVILTSPVIENYDNYDIKSGLVRDLDTSLVPNRITIEYYYRNKEYKRELYIKDASKYRKEGSYKILINKNKPQISYLKEMFE